MGDAIFPFKIDDAITATLIHYGIGSAWYPPDLQPGAEVVIKVGGLETALVELVFLGDPGGNAGESSMWGMLYIGVNNNKALVKITTVLARGAKVPH